MKKNFEKENAKKGDNPKKSTRKRRRKRTTDKNE